MTDSRTDTYKLTSVGPAETYPEYVARLRADLAALKSEQASPITSERDRVVEGWIVVIERELEQIGKAQTLSDADR